MNPWLVSLRPPPRPSSHTHYCGEGPAPVSCHSAALTACHPPRHPWTVSAAGGWGCTACCPLFLQGSTEDPPLPVTKGGGSVLCGGWGWSTKRPDPSLGHFSPDAWAPTEIPSCYPLPHSLTPSPSFLMSQPRHPPRHSSEHLGVVLDLHAPSTPRSTGCQELVGSPTVALGWASRDSLRVSPIPTLSPHQRLLPV